MQKVEETIKFPQPFWFVIKQILAIFKVHCQIRGSNKEDITPPKECPYANCYTSVLKLKLY